MGLVFFTATRDLYLYNNHKKSCRGSEISKFIYYQAILDFKVYLSIYGSLHQKSTLITLVEARPS